MKARRKYTDEQIVSILQEHQGGAWGADLFMLWSGAAELRAGLVGLRLLLEGSALRTGWALNGGVRATGYVGVAANCVPVARAEAALAGELMETGRAGLGRAGGVAGAQASMVTGVTPPATSIWQFISLGANAHSWANSVCAGS